MIGDMHCHTTMSDGSTSPEMLVEYALDAGLDFIAVTDHDTMAGVQKAVNLGKRKGLKVIPGVEVSTYDAKTGRNVHLLCYMPRKLDKLEKMINNTLKERNEAIKGVIEEVSKRYPITYDDVKKVAGDAQCIYRQHVATYLMWLISRKFGKLLKSSIRPAVSAALHIREDMIPSISHGNLQKPEKFRLLNFLIPQTAKATGKRSKKSSRSTGLFLPEEAIITDTTSAIRIRLEPAQLLEKLLMR